MSENAQRIDRCRLKGNASFTIREGWLAKGMRNVAKNPEVFLLDDATAILGVGSAMVKSIRYWLQTAGLTVEPHVGRRTQSFTEIGQIIMEYDPYFEDMFSLFVVHNNIASNFRMATVWYLLFNHFDTPRFTREIMEASLLATMQEMTSADFSLSSFQDDCSVALKTYVADKTKQASPEDNMQCPLAALGLFDKSTKYFERTMPSAEKLHPYAVLYVMLSAMGERTGISLDKLLTEPLNVGKILHLNAYRLNAYLDSLQADGMLNIQRTAGLNMIYPKEGLTLLEVARKYYRR